MKKNLPLITLVAGVLLAVVFLAYYLHHETEEKVLSQFNERQLLIARQTARQIESYFHSRSQDARYLSSFTSLQHRDVKTMSSDIQANFERLKTVHIKEIFVLDAMGKIVYSAGGDAIGSNYTRSDIYSWAKKPANKGMVRLAIERTDEQGAPPTGEGVKPPSPRISLVTPLYQESVDDGSPGPGGRFAGILLLTVDLERMLAERTLLFDPTKKSHTLWVWMMDEDGTLLLQSEHPSMVMKNIREKRGECNRCHVSFDYAEKIATEKQGTVEYQLKGRQKKIAAFAPMTFENTSWIVVVNSPFDEVTGFIRRNFRETLGLIGIVVVAIGLASFSMYRTYSQKVKAQEEVKHLREKQGLMEALQKSEERYRMIVETTHDIIWTLDTQGKFTFVNRRGEEVSGYRADELIGKSFVPLVHAEDLAKVQNIFMETLSGKPHFYDVRVYGKNSKCFILSVDTVPIFENNNIIGTLSSGRDITERKEAEEELRETRDYLENLLEYANAPVIVWDPEFRITRFNRAFELLTGRSAGEVLGKPLDILFPADRREEAMAHIRRTTTGERWESVEIQILRVDGSVRTLLWNSATLFAADGTTAIATIAQGQDITERKQAEGDIIRRNRELSVLHAIGGAVSHSLDLREILHSALEATLAALHIEMGAFFLLEPDGETMTMCAHRGLSDEFSRDVGKIRMGEGVSGRAAVEKIPIVLDVAEYPTERLAPYIVREGLRTIASTPLISGGSVVGALNLGARLPRVFPPEELQLLASIGLQLGQAVRNAQLYESVQKEVAERKQAEEEVRDAHRRFSFYVNRMPLAYIVWDTDFKVMEWNPAAERVFGWEANEAIGKHPHELIVPADEQSHVDKVWSKLLEGDESGYSLNANFRKDGKTITCEWFNAPLRDASGSVIGVLSMVHDVTEKTLLERQLQMAQKMESVGALAGGIAHDFNNVLTVIFGFGEMLKLRIANDLKAVSDLDEVLRSAERAAVLTRQLLTFARRQVVEPINLDLNEVMTDLVKLIRKVAREDIEIRIFTAERPVMTRVDRGQIEQVLMNLCLNARDAMPEGGQLVIETGVTLLEEEYLKQYPYMKAGRYAVLSVSDTGVGMDEKTRERVFEPFFTTKGPDKGSGLGLAMVYGIVKQHNGFIHVYSEPGKGTTFRVYFPEVDAPADAKVIASQGVAHGGSETILLAEDDESIRNLTEKILSSYGYKVLVACDGEEAVDIFRRHGKEIAMAVLDVVMPKKGGKQAYDEIARISPGLKVLFMSGYSVNAIHDSFVLLPGLPFLQKPFGPGALAKKVREVLDKA